MRLHPSTPRIAALAIGLFVGLVGPPSSTAAPAAVIAAAPVASAAAPGAPAAALPAGTAAYSAAAPPTAIVRGDGPDVVSSAQASPGAAAANDSAIRTVTLPAGRKAIATALASATCPDCRANATTVATVQASGRGTVSADNVAAAWSACEQCGATAVSVQLVLAPRASGVTAANRAMAVNADCSACTTSAAAVQFVIVGPSASGGPPADVISLLNGLGATVTHARKLPPRHDRLPRPPGPDVLSVEPAPNGTPLDETTITTEADRVRQQLDLHYGAAATQMSIDVQDG
jgi:hypothetical protein